MATTTMSRDQADEIGTTRRAKGMTQVDLAVKAGLGVRTIRNIEAGKPVKPATLTRVYKALGMQVTPAWPEEVNTFLQMVGYRLTSADRQERADLITRITQLLIGR